MLLHFSDLGDEASDATTVNKVSLMPEYLTVCCWRSAKEASLLLGQLVETAPVIDPNVNTATSGERTGLLSVEQVESTGLDLLFSLFEGGVPDTAGLAVCHPMALHFFLLCLKAVFQTLLR